MAMVDQLISQFPDNIVIFLRGIRIQSTNELFAQLSQFQNTSSPYQNHNNNALRNNNNRNNNSPPNNDQNNYNSRYSSRYNYNSNHNYNNNDSSSTNNNELPHTNFQHWSGKLVPADLTRTESVPFNPPNVPQI